MVCDGVPIKVSSLFFGKSLVAGRLQRWPCPSEKSFGAGEEREAWKKSFATFFLLPKQKMWFPVFKKGCPKLRREEEKEEECCPLC